MFFLVCPPCPVLTWGSDRNGRPKHADVRPKSPRTTAKRARSRSCMRTVPHRWTRRSSYDADPALALHGQWPRRWAKLLITTATSSVGAWGRA